MGFRMSGCVSKSETVIVFGGERDGGLFFPGAPAPGMRLHTLHPSVSHPLHTSYPRPRLSHSALFLAFFKIYFLRFFVCLFGFLWQSIVKCVSRYSFLSSSPRCARTRDHCRVTVKSSTSKTQPIIFLTLKNNNASE